MFVPNGSLLLCAVSGKESVPKPNRISAKNFGMLKIACRAALLATVLGATGQSLYASAFAIGELGVRAAGMGTAFISVANDGSAIFYNPAGIAFIEGAHMQMDSVVVVGSFRFTPSSPPPGAVIPAAGFSGAIKPHFIPIAAMYGTWQYNKKITLGIGLFTPFGLAANFTNFNDSDPNLTKFTGRFAGTRARLESYWFQPTIAYKINDNMAVSIGPAFVHTHLFLEKSILNPKDDALVFGRAAAGTVFPGVDKEQAAAVIARLLPEGRSRIAGTANSPALAAGFLYKDPKHKVNVGVMYRSAVTSHLKGQASFAFGSDYPLKQYIGADFLTKSFPNQAIKGSFTTPATYGVGVSKELPRNLLISVDLRLQDFHRFADVPLNFSVNEKNDRSSALPTEQRLRFNFRNSFHVAVGAEKILKPGTSVRLGYLYDKSPVVDKSVGPLFPDNNRNSFMLGGTHKLGNKEYSFFYEAMTYADRNINVPANNVNYTNGVYKNFVHLGGLGLRFDAKDFFVKKH